MGQKLNKNKMNMPPTETGRSMVEMLGGIGDYRCIDRWGCSRV